MKLRFDTKNVSNTIICFYNIYIFSCYKTYLKVALQYISILIYYLRQFFT